MPINHFTNRSIDGCYPDRLRIGDLVYIIQKEDQGTTDVKKLVLGNIMRILSHGDYYENGAKVEISISKKDFRYKQNPYACYIGRVQYIMGKVKNR